MVHIVISSVAIRDVLQRDAANAGAYLLCEAMLVAEVTPDVEEKKTLFRAAARRWLEQFSNAQNAAEAVKIAKTIGFPVVAKVVSAEILHKSDIGGVVLNLNSAAEVKKAFNDITARVKKIQSKTNAISPYSQ